VLPACVCGSTALAPLVPAPHHLAVRLGPSLLGTHRAAPPQQERAGEDRALLPNIGSHFMGRDLAH
jgi:hypothetical protein